MIQCSLCNFLFFDKWLFSSSLPLLSFSPLVLFGLFLAGFLCGVLWKGSWEKRVPLQTLLHGDQKHNTAWVCACARTRAREISERERGRKKWPTLAAASKGSSNSKPRWNPKNWRIFFVAIFLTSKFWPPQLTTIASSCTRAHWFRYCFSAVSLLLHRRMERRRKRKRWYTPYEHHHHNLYSKPTTTGSTDERPLCSTAQHQLLASWCCCWRNCPESAVQERWTEETTTNTCKYQGRGRELRERERGKHLFFVELHLIEKLKHTNTLENSFSVEMPNL